MKVNVMLLAVVCVAAICACNKNNNNNNAVNANDKTFVLMAALSNYAEISAGQLALTKTADPNVQMFAQKMITDHTKSQDSLQLIAGQLGLNAPDSLDAAHVQMAAMLSTMTGRAFDSTYVHGQVTDHMATVNLMQTESTNGNNSAVKSYVTNYLPPVQMHLMMADSLAKNY